MKRSAPEEFDDGGGPLYAMEIDGRGMTFTEIHEPTFRDRLAEHFKARPGVWIDGLELAKIGGAYASRTRVSECRTQLGMNIENRIRRVGNLKISEYRFLP